MARTAMETTEVVKRIVYASGCWDLFHIGHLNFLERAKMLGDVLIVGVNTDEVMTSYKVPPTIPFAQRCQIVEGLRCVDIVVPRTGQGNYEEILRCGATIRVISADYGLYKEQRWCQRMLEKHGVKHITILRTPDISTDKIRRVCYEKMAYCRLDTFSIDNLKL